MLFHNKDDIQFVTEFPCFLGHPVSLSMNTTFDEFFRCMAYLGKKCV